MKNRYTWNIYDPDTTNLACHMLLQAWFSTIITRYMRTRVNEQTIIVEGLEWLSCPFLREIIAKPDKPQEVFRDREGMGRGWGYNSKLYENLDFLRPVFKDYQGFFCQSIVWASVIYRQCYGPYVHNTTCRLNDCHSGVCT